MSKSNQKHSFQKISVIVPQSPFTPQGIKHPCLCVLDVAKLMEWWPGKPHSPHRDASKVKAIQRSLDWKRVAQIAAYLLQKEILDVSTKLKKYFEDIYEPAINDPGREWPPKVGKIIRFQVSEFPTFSNILIHVNGATINNDKEGTATLVFDEKNKKLHFSIIDGQHRINGAYFALCILKDERKDHSLKWEIPAEIFLDLDFPDGPPKNQAQIFIDVNFNQKKVDRSLVADLYPTARAFRETFGNKERAQDIGRKLMLETGPLVGMIQIPGIKYGVKDVITLSTLNDAIESILDFLAAHDITSLETQTEFISECLSSWLEASGRLEEKKELSPENVVYQGRVLVSIIALIPAMIWRLKNQKPKVKLLSEKSSEILVEWLKDIANRANMFSQHVFIDKKKFKERGYLGSGGIGRFRDSFWAVIIGEYKLNSQTSPEKIAELAKENKAIVWSELSKI